jgi:hypothetical protein
VAVIATGTFHALAKASGSNLCAKCLTANSTIPICAYADAHNARISLSTSRESQICYDNNNRGWGKMVIGAIIGDFAGIPQCRQKGQPQMTQHTFQHSK